MCLPTVNHHVQVLNWDILEPAYTDLEGVVSFEPTAESVVGISTVFTAARKDDDGSFHYFFSGTLHVPAHMLTALAVLHFEAFT